MKCNFYKLMFTGVTSIIIFSMYSTLVCASSGDNIKRMDLTSSWIGYISLAIFVISYLFVMAEEYTHLRKSKPVMLASGLIWAMIAYIYKSHGLPYEAEAAVRHNVLEYSELFLFLLVAMTYINSMTERNIFEALRCWMVNRGYGYRKLFWITGTLAFFISPIADNLTTALLMCAVVMAVGKDNYKFVSLSCINIVVGANAGGAYSPFGDITTLMVWQKGFIDFFGFFNLIIPSAVNYLVPAAIMHFAVPNMIPPVSTDNIPIKRGAKRMIALFGLTIVTAVCFHQFLNLPPMLGMMTGFSYLKLLGFYLKKTHGKGYGEIQVNENIDDETPFNVFDKVAKVEWDTLLFFYGVILCVGGLGFIGYLAIVSNTLYIQMGSTFANIMIGIISAIVDNIPVMFAVLTMSPDMPLGQWLLVTFTAGVGGSLLSIGSAAGVALMGASKGRYTFFGHLKWTPIIALGYAASILAHFLVNAESFNVAVHIR